MSSVISGYEAPPQRKHQVARLEQVAALAACGSGVCVPMTGGGGRYLVANETTREKLLAGQPVELDEMNAYAVSVLHNTCSCPLFQCVCKHVLYARMEHLRLGFQAEWADSEVSHLAPSEVRHRAGASPLEMLSRANQQAAIASHEAPSDVNAAVALQLTALSAVVARAVESLPAALACLQILADSPLADDAPPADVLERKTALASFDRTIKATRIAADVGAAAAGRALGGAQEQSKRPSARSAGQVNEDQNRSRQLRLHTSGAAENSGGSAGHGGTVKFSFSVARLPPMTRRADRDSLKVSVSQDS